MNQRFQNAEIRLVSEQYGKNELYRAISSIGSQLETELKEFGLCPEECFMEVLEILSTIADKGECILPETENLWHRKYNEYRRLDRKVCEDEIRKVVGIVFGFAILATDSSNHRFYRYKLSEHLTTIIARQKFDGWEDTLERIFSVHLPDGWFDAYIEEEPEGGDDIEEFAKDYDTLRKQMPCSNLVVQFVSKQYNSSCQQFMGKMENPQFIIKQGT